MNTWLIIKDGLVINSVVWDGVTPWLYELDHDQIIQAPNPYVGIGWLYDGKNFKEPVNEDITD